MFARSVKYNLLINLIAWARLIDKRRVYINIK